MLPDDTLFDRTLRCPYCGERIAVTVDASAGAQSYVEDCPVCCRPIDIEVGDGDGGHRVRARAEHER